MSVSNENNRVSYSGNGSTTNFSITFPFESSASLKVIQRVTSTGVETSKVETTHWTLAGTTLSMLVAPPSGTTLTIYRDPPLTQGLDLADNDSLPAESIESALDHIVYISQRLKDRLGRTVTLTDGYTGSFSPTLPSDFPGTPDAVLCNNPSGTGFLAAASAPKVTDITNATTYASNAAASASAAAASATAASTSQSAAATSASAASTSATAAATSATAASTSATNAATSATNAATSESNALTYKNAANTSATNAATSESNALTYKNAANTSATNAATSETNAANSATAAATSATSAAASAGSNLWGGTAGGSANALTLSPTPTPSSYVAGLTIKFLASAANTGSATLNVSSLGAKTMKRQDGSNLSANDLLSGYLYIAVYDGTNFVIGELDALEDDSATNAKLANMAQSTIKGRASGAGTGDPTDLTAQQVKDIVSTVPTIQKFTSGSGTYTTPSNVKWIKVKMVGGGGGGSGSGVDTGLGGAGGTGGNTTFGTSLLVANGGTGGTAQSTGPSGGTASLGTAVGTAITGGSGNQGGRTNTNTVLVPGGTGGSSPLASGGSGNVNAAGGAGATNSGAGGGGGGGVSIAAQFTAGTSGAAGGYVEAIITSPSATYSYAVGAAGTAGTAGTSGLAGGAGGSGYIIVEEYYI